MSSRSYRSTVRAQHAEDTRRTILTAAGDLFARDGYPRTSIAAIAAAAGVAVNTVYTSVGGKPALLRALTEAGLEDTAINATLEQLEAAGSAREMLRIMGAGTCKVRRNQAQILGVVLDNRSTDPDIEAAAELSVRTVKARYAVVARRLLATGDLQAGLTVADVQQVLYFYFGFEAWRTARSLGWSWSHTTTWLTTQATQALVSP